MQRNDVRRERAEPKASTIQTTSHACYACQKFVKDNDSRYYTGDLGMMWGLRLVVRVKSLVTDTLDS